MFTKEQIEEIGKKLSLTGVKDTDFDEITQVKPEDYVVIIQDNKNYIVKFQTILDLASTVIIK